MVKSKPKPVAKPKASLADPTTAYARDVVSGNAVAGRYVRLACERHLRDLESGHLRGLKWNREAAQQAIDFYSLLNHSKGRWAGTPFILSPWQQFATGSVHGWKRANGYRRFRISHIEVARKNGKTTYASGEGLHLFILDDEPGAEVYNIATKRDQAKLTHEESKRMVNASPSLKRRIVVYRDNMHTPGNHSKYEPLSAEGDSLDGLNVHGFIADELHAWKSRLLWDVMETATGARSQPFGLITTTAGYDRHSIWWERREIAIKALEAATPDVAGFDDSIFALIYTLDDGDDWKDEKTWIKANPNLGVTVQIEDLREKCQQAIVTPGKQNPFKRLHLNMPTEQADRWLSMELWDKCKTPLGREEFRESLRGKPCFGALDLSAKIDLTAFGLVFPLDDGRYAALVEFWMPEATGRRRSDEDRVPYPLWAEQGWVNATPGDWVDFSIVRAAVNAARNLYDIREIAYDPWNAEQMAQELKADGFEMVEFRQGWPSMSEPSKEFERLLTGNLLAHDGNPCLRWNVNNCAAKQDPAGNLKPDKSESTGRIDGVVAIVMGIGRASLMPPPTNPTVEVW